MLREILKIQCLKKNPKPLQCSSTQKGRTKIASSLDPISFCEPQIVRIKGIRCGEVFFKLEVTVIFRTSSL